MQTNGVDCGLWVLVAIVAVLCGYQVMALRKEDMVGFRELLFNYISLLHATM
jgi:Ulp1 family protease